MALEPQLWLVLIYLKSGVPQKNITMIDRTGVIFRGRENLNQWKSAHAIETKDRTLDDAIKNADVFLGLSVKVPLLKIWLKRWLKIQLYLLVQSRSRNYT